MRGLFLFLFLFLFLSPLLLWGVGGSRLGLDPSSFKFEYLASSFDQIEFNCLFSFFFFISFSFFFFFSFLFFLFLKD